MSGGGGFPTHAGTESGPEEAQPLAGMTHFDTDPAGDGHAAEVFGFHGAVGLQSEEHGRRGILAVGGVPQGGHVFAVGDAAFVDIGAEEAGSALDGGIDFRIDGLAGGQQGLLAEHDRDVGDVAAQR